MSRRLIDRDELEKLMFSYYACVNRDTNKSNYQGETLMNYEVADLIEDCLDNATVIDAVELPCKIGDKVWIARRYKCHKKPRWGVVSEMFFTDDMELCIVVKGVARGKWGVDVFATYEEAEAQIERNSRKD